MNYIPVLFPIKSKEKRARLQQTYRTSSVASRRYQNAPKTRDFYNFAAVTIAYSLSSIGVAPRAAGAMATLHTHTHTQRHDK